MTIDVDQFEICGSVSLCKALKAHSLKIGAKDKIDDEFLDYLLLEHILYDFDCETEIVYFLVILGRCGINVNATSSRGATPISIAICRGFFCVAFMLVTMGADLDFISDEGHTVVLQAVKKAIEDPDDTLARSFLRLAVIESSSFTKNRPSSESGLTALGIAVCSFDVALVTVLLESGSDVNALDTWGRSPLQVLNATPDTSQEREVVEKLLVSHGGKIQHLYGSHPEIKWVSDGLNFGQ